MDMSLSKLRKLVMEREAWHAAVHGITKSWTWLSDWTEYTNHCVCMLSWVWLYDPIDCSPLVFLSQEYWSELPFPFPEDLSNPGKESVSLASPELAGCFFTVEPLGEAPFSCLVKSLSHVRLFATPWTAAYQDPPSMGFSRQEYGVGCHCSST